MKKTGSSIWYSTFTKYTNQKVITNEVIYKFLTIIYQLQKQNCTILDIGCGEGTITYLAERFLDTNCNAITYSCIDKEAHFIERTRDKANKLGIYTNLMLIGDCFNNDLNKLPDNTTLIIVSHILYYTDDIDSFILRLKTKIGPQTMVIFIHESEFSDINIFRSLYQSKVNANVDVTLQQILTKSKLHYTSYTFASKLNLEYKKITPNNIYYLLNNSDSDTKNLLEFIVHLPLEHLDSINLLDFYLKQLTNVLRKQNDKLVIWTTAYVVSLHKLELPTSKDNYNNLLNFQDNQGFTNLHWAAFHNDISITKSILSKTVDIIDITDKDLFTALHIAIIKGHSDIIDILLESNADINIENNGLIAILAAIFTGKAFNISIYRRLEKKELSINKFMLWIKKTAEEYYPPSLYDLGIIYSKSDYEKSLQYIETAAELNYVPAIYKIFEVYQSSCIIPPKKIRESIKQYPHSYDSHYDYLIRIAKFSEPYCSKKLLEFFLVGSNKGDILSLYSLAYIYQNGFVIEKNLQIATQLYYKAAKLGLVYAKTALAILFEGYELHTQALKWYNAAALNKEPIAQYNLAILYIEGISIKPNYTVALKWLNEINENCKNSTWLFNIKVKSLYNLGIIYAKHLNNSQKAVEFFEQAASFNFTKAHNALHNLDFNNVDFEIEKIEESPPLPENIRWDYWIKEMIYCLNNVVNNDFELV